MKKTVLSILILVFGILVITCGDSGGDYAAEEIKKILKNASSAYDIAGKYTYPYTNGGTITLTFSTMSGYLNNGYFSCTGPGGFQSKNGDWSIKNNEITIKYNEIVGGNPVEVKETFVVQDLISQIKLTLKGSNAASAILIAFGAGAVRELNMQKDSPSFESNTLKPIKFGGYYFGSFEKVFDIIDISSRYFMNNVLLTDHKKFPTDIIIIDNITLKKSVEVKGISGTSTYPPVFKDITITTDRNITITGDNIDYCFDITSGHIVFSAPAGTSFIISNPGGTGTVKTSYSGTYTNNGVTM